MKKIKGVLLFIAFIALAGGFYYQPDIGLMHWMSARGINPLTWAALFAVSGLVNLMIGWCGGSWNALWFAVYFAYTTMMWVAIAEGCEIPVAQAVSNTLLSTFLGLELLEGTRRWGSLR